MARRRARRRFLYPWFLFQSFFLFLNRAMASSFWSSRPKILLCGRRCRLTGKLRLKDPDDERQHRLAFRDTAESLNRAARLEAPVLIELDQSRERHAVLESDREESRVRVH